MTLNIKDPEAHKLARKLAEQTGETMTRAVTEALVSVSHGLPALRSRKPPRMICLPSGVVAQRPLRENPSITDRCFMMSAGCQSDCRHLRDYRDSFQRGRCSGLRRGDHTGRFMPHVGSDVR